MKKVILLGVAIALIGSFGAYAQQPRKAVAEVTTYAGVGIMLAPRMMSPIVYDQSLLVTGWINPRWQIGGMVSLDQMQLRDGISPGKPGEAIMNHLYVGPVLSLSPRDSARDGWSLTGSISMGYTYLFKQKGTLRDPLCESFQQGQHGFGAGLTADVRRSFGDLYFGLGLRWQSRTLFRVGEKSNPGKTTLVSGIPLFIFGFSI